MKARERLAYEDRAVGAVERGVRIVDRVKSDAKAFADDVKSATTDPVVEINKSALLLVSSSITWREATQPQSLSSRKPSTKKLAPLHASCGRRKQVGGSYAGPTKIVRDRGMWTLELEF